MTYQSIAQLFEIQPKSKFKASDGLKSGKYPFFASSQDKKLFTNTPSYQGPAIVLGTGGSASLHFCDVAFSTSADCYVLKPKDKSISTKAIAYYLEGNIHKLESGFRGAGLKHISKTFITKVEVPDISLNEGERVVSILDKIINVLRLRKQSINKLFELQRSVFYEMFGNPISNPKG